MRERLGRFLSDVSGTAVMVTRMERITDGHSRAMYRVECSPVGRDGFGPFVVRMEQGGVFGTSSAEEFGVMRALAGAGIPVANVRWMEATGEVLGFPFFVMDLLTGDEAGNSRAMSRESAVDFIRALRKMHSVDAVSAGVPFVLRPGTPNDATHLQIDRWADTYRSASPVLIPLLEESAAWLHANAPELSQLAVVHGDAGPGNVVVADGRVVALTDFEFTHLGDPAEDWSFCVSMRGSRSMSRDAWLSVLADNGVVLTDWQWTYWEAFNLFKGACANRTCLTLFQSGVNPAPNMAIIGTTLHQVFLQRLAGLIEAHPGGSGEMTTAVSDQFNSAKEHL